MFDRYSLSPYRLCSTSFAQKKIEMPKFMVNYNTYLCIISEHAHICHIIVIMPVAHITHCDL